MSIEEIEEKLLRKQSSVDVIFENMIAGTNFAVDDFQNDEISIIAARVDKIEEYLIKSASFSFSSFAFEFCLTLAMGPILKHLLLNPIVKVFSEKAIKNKQIIAGLYLAGKDIYKVKQNLEALTKKSIGTIDYGVLKWLEGLKPKDIKALQDNYIAYVGKVGAFTTDTISEALKKGSPGVIKAISSRPKAKASNFVDAKAMATEIATQIVSKIIELKNEHALDVKLLISQLHAQPDPSSMLAEIDDIMKKLDEVEAESIKIAAEDSGSKTFDSVTFQKEWKQLVRQLIWVTIIGSGKNIATVVTKEMYLVIKGTSGEKALSEDAFTDDEGDKFKFMQLKISEASVNTLIKNLPSYYNSFLDQAIEIFTSQHPKEEQITSDYIVNHPSYGIQPESEDQLPTFSIRDNAVQMLMTWIDIYNINLKGNAGELDIHLSKF